MRILIVEDEERMSALLSRGLREEGYTVDHATTVEDGLWLGKEFGFDAIVLDANLPDGDGFDLCRSLRDRKVAAPILMLTARDSVADRVSGLDSGADDYLTKPFSFDELVARIRALLRRGAGERNPILAAGPLRVDPASHIAMLGEEPVLLSAREYSLLEYLIRNKGKVVSRTHIREHVWESGFEGNSNVVDVYVRYLRDKIDRRCGITLIETIRGVGYRMNDGHR